jgi:hypothetical protein
MAEIGIMDDRTFPDTEGRRAWCLDRAVSVIRTDAAAIVAAAKLFEQYIQGDD